MHRLIDVLKARSRGENCTPEEIEKYRSEIHVLQDKLDEDWKKHRLKN